MLTLALLLITQLLVLAILAWGVCTYVRLRRQLRNIQRIMTMNCEDLIDELLEADSGAVAKEIERRAGPETTHQASALATGTGTTSQHRERLDALAAGGRARQYLGKPLSVDQVDKMDEEELEKLYSRYESRLGAAMTRTLGAAALQLYTSAASMLLPIPPELESDPFVEHAVSGATCELYHRFGMYLTPVTAALTTLRHCRFGQHDVQSIDSCDGNRNSADTGTECHDDRVDGGVGESDNACASRGFADG